MLSQTNRQVEIQTRIAAEKEITSSWAASTVETLIIARDAVMGLSCLLAETDQVGAACEGTIDGFNKLISRRLKEQVIGR